MRYGPVVITIMPSQVIMILVMPKVDVLLLLGQIFVESQILVPILKRLLAGSGLIVKIPFRQMPDVTKHIKSLVPTVAKLIMDLMEMVVLRVCRSTLLSST